MEVYLLALLGNYDRPTDRTAEVSLPINWLSFLFSLFWFDYLHICIISFPSLLPLLHTISICGSSHLWQCSHRQTFGLNWLIITWILWQKNQKGLVGITISTSLGMTSNSFDKIVHTGFQKFPFFPIYFLYVSRIFPLFYFSREKKCLYNLKFCPEKLPIQVIKHRCVSSFEEILHPTRVSEPARFGTASDCRMLW